MKAGTLGAVIVIAGGAALGAAIFGKDKAQLALAQSKLDDGRKLLDQGKTAEALEEFTRALDSALHVGGVSGSRPQALDVARDAGRAIHLCEELLKLQAGEPSALATVDAAIKDPHGLAKEPLEKVASKRLAQIIYETAKELERLAIEEDRISAEDAGRVKAEYHELARTAFKVAGKVAQEGGFDWVGPCDDGARRAEARALVAEALASNASDAPDAGDKARDFADRANKLLDTDPFKGTGESDTLKKAVASIAAEAQDRALVDAFKTSVNEAWDAVGTNQLGKLLAKAQGITVPKLAGGYRTYSTLDGQVSELKGRLEKVVLAATDFQDMVLALEKGDVKVYVDRTEVTNEAWKKFTDEKKPYTDGRNAEVWGSDDGASMAADLLDASFKAPGPATWTNGTFPDGKASHPVAGISPLEARAFARARGKRLPSYDEWLGAAGRPGTLYPWGNEWREGGGNVKGTDTQPVGSSPRGATSTDAVDMIGNVREIVEDGKDLYAVGGSYSSAPEAATLKAKVRVLETARPVDQGFRCARELKWNKGE